jgi:hypothetical protein
MAAAGDDHFELGDDGDAGSGLVSGVAVPVAVF